MVKFPVSTFSYFLYMTYIHKSHYWLRIIKHIEYTLWLLSSSYHQPTLHSLISVESMCRTGCRLVWTLLKYPPLPHYKSLTTLFDVPSISGGDVGKYHTSQCYVCDVCHCRGLVSFNYMHLKLVMIFRDHDCQEHLDDLPKV